MYFMNRFKTVITLFAAAGICLSASAQVVRGPYETNKAFDNTFLGIGVGANTVIGNPLGLWSYGTIGLAADLNFGKWWTPAVGMRLGYHGLTDASVLTFDRNSGGQIDPRQSFGLHYLHGEVLWNIFNSIFGYKRERFWNLIPYFEMGVLDISMSANPFDRGNLEYAAGAGLLSEFRLTDRINATLDLNAPMGKCKAYSSQAGRFIFFPSANIGLQFKFGKTYWDRHTDVVPVVVPVPFTEAQYLALAERAAALEKENAELREKAAALENQLASYSNLVDGQTYLYENGTFTAIDVKPGCPVAVFFDLDSDKITARELAHLEFFAAHVVDADTKLTLNGYADRPTGNPRYNQGLSERRVKAVTKALVKLGAKEENISTAAHGDTIQPFEGMEKNRVVTIELK